MCAYHFPTFSFNRSFVPFFFIIDGSKRILSLHHFAYSAQSIVFFPSLLLHLFLIYGIRAQHHEKLIHYLVYDPFKTRKQKLKHHHLNQAEFSFVFIFFSFFVVAVAPFPSSLSYSSNLYIHHSFLTVRNPFSFVYVIDFL